MTQVMLTFHWSDPDLTEKFADLGFGWIFVVLARIRNLGFFRFTVQNQISYHFLTFNFSFSHRIKFYQKSAYLTYAFRKLRLNLISYEKMRRFWRLMVGWLILDLTDLILSNPIWVRILRNRLFLCVYKKQYHNWKKWSLIYCSKQSVFSRDSWRPLPFIINVYLTFLPRSIIVPFYYFHE